MQVKNIILSVVVLVLVGSAPSAAAGTALGRVTYISQDGHQLMLDNSKEYTIAPTVNVQSIGVAEFVRVTLGAHNEITRIEPGPADQAAYSGAGGPS